MQASHEPPPMPAEQVRETGSRERIVNDFSIQVATVNGSGSQTANLVLMRSIFQMGVPVSGKNLFPSNIQGLPTWFTIRASRRGFIARKKEVDFLVAMNPESAREDVMSLPPGAAVLYDEPLKLDGLRSDLHFYSAPFDKLVAPVCPEAKLRKLVRNMIYVGILAELLGIDPEQIRKALYKQFGERKKKAADLNWGAVQAGIDYARTSLAKSDPFVIEPMDQTAGRLIIEGNTAAALGCMFAGVTVCTWYPITPSSSLAEALITYMERFRRDPATGKATYAIVQAEDELASIGMAVGAGWAGARSMTCTSGPGISLMSELLGLAYFAEIPVVVIDVQRVGPSTGLPTRTMQGDTLKNAVVSHGDTRHPVLFPSSPEECFSMSIAAFDLAERFQTPVFVNMDLDLGMNYWMSDPLPYPEKPIDRGKVLSAADLDRLGGFARYKDVDGDGVAWRTLPGTPHPKAAYFTRGTGHTGEATYSERPEDWIRNMDRIARKFETLRAHLPPPVQFLSPGAKIGLVSVGTSRYAMEESREQLGMEAGIEASWMRLTAYPFPAELEAFIEQHERVYVIDQNRDAQLLGLMRLDLPPQLLQRLRSVRYYGGLPLDARTVTESVLAEEA
ncbi:MAG: 2-oxoacid:acceptor oxidoreductase subunit alpha [Bryobacteraceae bacterium]